MMRCHHRPPSPPTAMLPTSWPRLSSACVPARSRAVRGARSASADRPTTGSGSMHRSRTPGERVREQRCLQDKQPCRELPGPRRSPDPSAKQAPPSAKTELQTALHGRKKTTCYPRGVHGTGALADLRVLGTRFSPAAASDRPHPVVIAGLRLSSALLGGNNWPGAPAAHPVNRLLDCLPTWSYRPRNESDGQEQT